MPWQPAGWHGHLGLVSASSGRADLALPMVNTSLLSFTVLVRKKKSIEDNDSPGSGGAHL